MKEPYDVLEVCRYAIEYSNNKGYGISNLKLQKILYFIQAYFLINTQRKRPCFGDKIEAWNFGPVVPRAYYEYRRFGSTNIPTMKSIMRINYDNIWDSEREYFDDNNISDKDKKRIREVIDTFSNYSATSLVTLTHNQDTWKNAYQQNMNNEITIDAIREYFKEDLYE